MIGRFSETGIIFAFVYPPLSRPFYRPRAVIVTLVAPGSEKLKRLQPGFTELRENHAEK